MADELMVEATAMARMGESCVPAVHPTSTGTDHLSTVAGPPFPGMPDLSKSLREVVRALPAKTLRSLHFAL